jgi:DNA-binding transcriptional LysR family regulator
MQSVTERGVLYSEHALQRARRELLNWGAVRVSLEVFRQGSYRSAAKRLGMSVNALRRRVEELEHALGLTLLTPYVKGVRATPEGEEIFAAALRMESASYDLLQARDQSGGGVAGEVRLAVTEGLGTFWIAPRLVEFQRANPKLLVDVNCAMQSADVLRMEADAAIQITRPTSPDMRIVKLGRLHLIPYAAPGYLDTFGYPKSTADLINHRILIQSDDNAQWRVLYDRIFPGVPPASVVALRTNVSSAHYWSIARGAGIGMLPTYAQWLGVDITPLELGIYETMDIWLTYHPKAKRVARVARLIDWILQAFSPQKYPWFREEFIHPEKLKTMYQGEPRMAVLAERQKATAAI